MGVLVWDCKSSYKGGIFFLLMKTKRLQRNLPLKGGGFSGVPLNCGVGPPPQNYFPKFTLVSVNFPELQAASR